MTPPRRPAGTALLAAASVPCYGFRLRPFLRTSGGHLSIRPYNLRNIFRQKCHELFDARYYGFVLLAVSLAPHSAVGQIYRPPLIPPPAQTAPPNAANPNLRLRTVRPTAPPVGFVAVEALTQEADGPLRHLRGNVRLETQEMLLTADEVDYNQETGDAEARGHVKFEHFTNGDKLQCERAKYNLNSETGTFYEISGTSPAKIQSRPGV